MPTPRNFLPIEIAEMRTMRANAAPWEEIAARFDANRTTIQNVAIRNGFLVREPSTKPARKTIRKKGNPRTLAPEVDAELERLVTQSALAWQDIADQLNARYGCAVTRRQVVHQAKREGMIREAFTARRRDPAAVEQRLLDRAWERWARGTVPESPVRRVAAGTFPGPAGGYRMGAT